MLKHILPGLLLAAVMATLAAPGLAVGGPLATQTNEAQGVKLTVTPLDLAGSAQTWTFEVTLETHVRDLTDEMTRAASLLADGNRYAPVDWAGAPPGGHHRKGSLRFTPVRPYPASVELQIRLQGETAPRTFHWALKGANDAN